MPQWAGTTSPQRGRSDRARSDRTRSGGARDSIRQDSGRRPGSPPPALKPRASGDLARQLAGLAHRGLEGIANGQRQLRMRGAALALMAHDDGTTARNAKLDLDLEHLGFL